jgi:hypothetical protein
LLGEPISEELVQGNRRAIAENCHLMEKRLKMREKYQNMENSFHKFVIVEKGSIWVNVTLNQILSHTVRSHKQCIVNNLHELSWVTIKGATGYL